MIDKILKLSARLTAVAERIKECDTLIDVGTDHALLPIYCVFAKKCKKAIASDISEGAMDKARKNLKKYMAEEQITLARSDGLENIDVTPEDCVVISGMGGNEIIRIMSRDIVRARQIILSPHKSLYELRKFLCGSGYSINDETVISEKNKYYVILECKYTGRKQKVSFLEAHIGKSIINKSGEHVVKGYLDHLRKKYLKMSLGDKKLNEVIEKIDQLKEGVHENI